MFDGKAYGEEIVGLVRGFVEREVAPLKAENESLKARLAALEARPAPEKGEAGEKGQDGADGVSPAPEAVAEMLRPIAETMIGEAVAKAIGELPTPEKGEPGNRGEKGEPGEAGADGKDGCDGADVTNFLIDRDGNLVATLSTGATKNLGPVCGKDGDPGKDGRDGIELDSFEAIVLDDDRTIELKFVSGDTERVASFKWPQPLDCGVYKSGEQYQRGDMVTWGGSLWLAQRDTDAKPDTADSGWRLACKKGRDGKDAK